ncbi:hypothetical protein AB0E67_32485 [Streptomyces sp. NPDC032161]
MRGRGHRLRLTGFGKQVLGAAQPYTGRLTTPADEKNPGLLSTE